MTVAVFGSWARGTATPVSDIDLLIVGERLPPSRRKRVAEFETVEEATQSIRLAVWEGQNHAPDLSPIIKAQEEVEAGSPLFLDMTDWCRILWDRDDFFARYLAGLRKRLRRHGARRRWAKGGYYWEYKPDLKPGEVIEL